MAHKALAKDILSVDVDQLTAEMNGDGAAEHTDV